MIITNDHNKQFQVQRSKLCQVQLFCMHVFMCTFVYMHIPAIDDVIVDKNVMEVHVTVCTCMNADINMNIYANTQAHMKVYLCTFMYIYVWTRNRGRYRRHECHGRPCDYVYMHEYRHKYVYMCKYTCTYKYVCIYIYIHVNTYIHMNIYIHVYICIYVCTHNKEHYRRQECHGGPWSICACMNWDQCIHT